MKAIETKTVHFTDAEYAIGVDVKDGKYKIFKTDNGVRVPVGEFYRLCDREARDVRELIDN